MNYVVMNEIDEDYDNNSFSKKKNNNYKKIFLIIGVVVFLIIVGFIILNTLDNNSINYQDIENKMVESARIYVQKSNLSSKNGLYITNDYLEVKTRNCSDISGVIVDGSSYSPYLVCDNYTSKIINNDETYGKLNGGAVVIVDKNNGYYDLGCSTNYNVEVITDYANHEGVYTYLYKIKNNNVVLGVLTRKVVVFDKDASNSGLTFELKGDKVVYLTDGEVYNEQGVIAIDSKDGDISKSVIILNNVNYDIPGEYEIKYTINTSSGYSSNIVRKIIVGEKNDNGEMVVNSMYSPISNTNESVKITILVSGDNYKHMILPDGNIVTDKIVEYEAKENGMYTFSIYDKKDNPTIKQIEINNIDKVLPSGVCSAITYSDYTEVKVSNVNKESCIYNYETTNHSSIYVADNNYRISIGNVENVSVNIKDMAGNVGKINCEVQKDKSLINKEYVNDKGYYCIEPYTCFKQGDYYSSNYCYKSTEDSCGPINKTGCSITSVSTILSKWDKRSSNGQLFNPYTLMDETVTYKKCNSCSGDTTAQRVFKELGLQVVGDNYYKLEMSNYDILLNHLKEGNPALIRVGTGWYTNGGHLMALLTANEEGLVYLSDPGVRKGQKNGYGHAVNTFVPLNDVIKGSGESSWFLMVKE